MSIVQIIEMELDLLSVMSIVQIIEMELDLDALL